MTFETVSREGLGYVIDRDGVFIVWAMTRKAIGIQRIKTWSPIIQVTALAVNQ